MTTPRGTVRLRDLTEAERRLTLALLAQKRTATPPKVTAQEDRAHAPTPQAA